MATTFFAIGLSSTSLVLFFVIFSLVCFSGTLIFLSALSNSPHAFLCQDLCICCLLCLGCSLCVLTSPLTPYLRTPAHSSGLYPSVAFSGELSWTNLGCLVYTFKTLVPTRCRARKGGTHFCLFPWHSVGKRLARKPWCWLDRVKSDSVYVVRWFPLKYCPDFLKILLYFPEAMLGLAFERKSSESQNQRGSNGKGNLGGYLQGLLIRHPS